MSCINLRIALRLPHPHYRLSLLITNHRSISLSLSLSEPLLSKPTTLLLLLANTVRRRISSFAIIASNSLLQSLIVYPQHSIDLSSIPSLYIGKTMLVRTVIDVK
mmetsp:Transcript_3464/g.7757  ORF Transcript_3464/g.7757 Transcript_3464/m.7757 type:complete len:105 (+) Transcript_3464:507-821(+)